jgi:predicted secreted protein
MLKGELQYTDKRSRKMVYMSRCILNCNAKFPGCADVPGVYTEIIHPIAKAGIGIEQMPCLEIMGWGGVDRPLVMHELDPKNPNADWVQEYPKLCKREAIKVVDQMQDYLGSGFEILGVIYVDDSPTCGLTNTQVFPDVHFQIMEMDIPEDKIFDFEYTFNVVLPQLHASGEGAFGYQLYLEVERRNLGIPFVPFGPTKPRDEEVKRILDDLSLTL